MIRELSMQLVGAWHDTSWIELIAAGLAIAYLVLAISQRISCWSANFVSSCLYVWVFFEAHLYMDSALNVFYAAMAGYGFWQWRTVDTDGAHHVRRWSLSRNALAAAGILALSGVNWYFLSRYTPAAFPFVDSMVSWAAVFATFLVAPPKVQAADLQQKYRQFLDLLPLTVALAGLPPQCCWPVVAPTSSTTTHSSRGSGSSGGGKSHGGTEPGAGTTMTTRGQPATLAGTAFISTDDG